MLANNGKYVILVPKISNAQYSLRQLVELIIKQFVFNIQSIIIVEFSSYVTYVMLRILLYYAV